MDITTLALARNYTDEQIKQNSIGGVDLSEYYTKKEIDAMDFVTSNELPEGNIVDKTLTIEGQAADAKATGDRLGAIEYQTVMTDEVYEHKDLPEEKTIIISNDGIFDSNVYINYGEDLIPRKEFRQNFPFRGVTVTKKDKEYEIKGNCTQAAVINFASKSKDVNIPISSELWGKSFKFITFCSQVIGTIAGVGVKFLDNSSSKGSDLFVFVGDGTTTDFTITNADFNKIISVTINGEEISSSNYTINSNQIAFLSAPLEGDQIEIEYSCKNIELLKVTKYIASTSKVQSKDLIIPENTVYMQMWINTAIGEHNYKFQVYLVPNEEIENYSLTETNVIENIKSSHFMTFPYKSIASFKLPFQDYLQYILGNTAVTFITPEEFGAKGDGFSDDSEAIAKCLIAAEFNKQIVLMAKKYYIEKPIDIIQCGLNLIINDIIYNGKEEAIKIRGQQNTLQIHKIDSTNVGLSFCANADMVVHHNNITVNTINSGSHGIVFYTAKNGMYQINVKFDHINAGGQGCYGICTIQREEESWIGERNFWGGHISNCDWAVYKVSSGRFYGIQIEQNVQGGFYINKFVEIYAPRSAESSRDGNLPYFKFIETEGVYIKLLTGIPISEFDLSEANDMFQNDTGLSFPLHEYDFGVVDGIIMSQFDQDEEGKTIYVNPNVLCNKAYIWGKFLIMQPHMAYRRIVDTSEFDVRATGQTGNKDLDYKTLTQLPTKFIVNTINCNIYLHESYCAFGFKEFEVEQSNNFTCKVHDKLGNLIFDGTDKGNGIYKFKVYKDAEKSRQYGAGLLRRDFLGHYWEVTKETTVNDILNALPTWSGGAY